MFDVEQEKIIATTLHETIQLLQKAIEKLSEVFETIEDPAKRKQMKRRAGKQISDSVKKHFS